MPESSRPTSSAVAALIRLLGDDDHGVARACAARLLHWGAPARTAVQQATRSDDARVRVRARAILRSMTLRAATERFVADTARARSGRDPRGLLEAGLVALQRFAIVRLPAPGGLSATLDDLAATLEPSVRGRATPTCARHLAQVLAVGAGLCGGSEPASVDGARRFPEAVLRHGRGASATLAAIYLLVARRAGLDATAVRLPGYFLVRLHGRRRVLVDPFHGGRTVTRGDCLRYLREIGEPGGLDHLADVGDADVLAGVVEDVADHVRDPEIRLALCRALERALPRAAADRR